MNTIKAPDNIKRHSTTYNIIDQKENVVLYEAQSNTSKAKHYEVHKLRFERSVLRQGKQIKEHYRMASNEEFGRYGWSYDSLSTAQIKFSQLLKQRTEV